MIKNCKNCGQAIGHLEPAYSFYGRFICKACKTKLDNPFQASGATNGAAETETSTVDVRAEKDSATNPPE